MKKSTAPARSLKVQPFTRSEIVHFAFTSKHLTPRHHVRLLMLGGGMKLFNVKQIEKFRDVFPELTTIEQLETAMLFSLGFSKKEIAAARDGLC